MQIRAIHAYQTAATYEQHHKPQRTQPQQQPTLQSTPPPLVGQLFTRNGKAQTHALGQYIDKRV